MNSVRINLLNYNYCECALQSNSLNIIYCVKTLTSLNEDTLLSEILYREVVSNQQFLPVE